MTAPEWLRAYATLALRINRQVTETTGGTVLIYRGPDEWSAEVAAHALAREQWGACRGWWPRRWPPRAGLADRQHPRRTGILPDGSDFAAIHDAKNVLWGTPLRNPGHTAFLAAEGRPATEIGGYLSRWALLDDAELAPALASLTAPGMDVYALGYYHGWRLVRAWLAGEDGRARTRRLLTEQLLPADLGGKLVDASGVGP